MAGRFVFQKLASSGMSRSASRLFGALASASVRGTAPVMPRASEDGIRNLSKFFHAAAVRPAGLVVVPSVSNHGGIHGYGTARYLSTLPCLPPRVPAKFGRLKARMSPSINNHNKSSALVDSVGQEPWHSRLVDWAAAKKKKGLNRIDIFLIKLVVLGNLMIATLACIWPEDVSMIPSQSLHCSGCNCPSRLHCSGCNCPSRR